MNRKTLASSFNFKFWSDDDNKNKTIEMQYSKETHTNYKIVFAFVFILVVGFCAFYTFQHSEGDYVSLDPLRLAICKSVSTEPCL